MERVNNSRIWVVVVAGISLIGLVFWLLTPPQTGNKASSESLAIMALVSRLNDIQENGIILNDWEDVLSRIGSSSLELKNHDNEQGSVTNLYVMVTNIAVFPQNEGDRVVVIRAEPVKNQSGVWGRHAIRQSGREFRYLWLSEEDAKGLVPSFPITR